MKNSPHKNANALLFLLLLFNCGLTLLNIPNILSQCPAKTTPSATVTAPVQEIQNLPTPPKQPDLCEKVQVSKTSVCLDGTFVSLNLMPGEQRERFYEDLLNRIREPSLKQKKFAPISENPKLTVVLVEIKEGESPRLKKTLYNIAHVYGGSNTALTIVSNAVLYNEIKRILNDGWVNVEIVLLGGPQTTANYNFMLTSSWFWKLFSTEYTLITHTDSMIYRRLDEWMFEYELIGAPWVPGCDPQVGNGGYTLRKVSVMLQVVNSYDFKSENPNGIETMEDIWWAHHLDKIPNAFNASEFSVETYSPSDAVPTGSHKIYRYSPFEHFGDAFRRIQMMW